MRATIDIQGIRQFQRQLRQMEGGLHKKIRVALNSAAEIVVRYAKPKVARRSGTAAASLKVRSTQREAAVAAGGARAPYYPWLDFGGRTGPNRSVQRAFISEGRYIYPTVRERGEEIAAAGQTALNELAAEAGLEVT